MFVETSPICGDVAWIRLRLLSDIHILADAQVLLLAH